MQLAAYDQARQGANEICVTFVLTRWEFEQAMHCLFRAMWQCRWIPICGAVLLVIGLFVALVDSVDRGTPLLGLGTVWLAWATWIYWMVPRRQYHRRVRLQGEQSHCFSSHGCTQRFIDLESRMQWSLFTGMLETRDVYVLVLERRSFNVIPRRAFNTAEQEAQFRDLVRRHVETNKPAVQAGRRLG